MAISPLTPEEIISIYPEYQKFRDIKYFCDIMSVPFYLRLIADKALELSLQSLNTFSNFELKNYIVDLAIKGAHNFGKKRKLMIEKIVNLQNSLCRSTPGCFSIGNIAVSLENFNADDREIINSLITDNVLTNNENGVYFQHDIYMDWAIYLHLERSLKIIKIKPDVKSFQSALRSFSSYTMLDWLEYRFGDVFSIIQPLLKNMDQALLNEISALIVYMTITAVYLDKIDEFTFLTNLPGFTNLDIRTNHLRAKDFHQYTYLLLAITVSSKRIVENILNRGGATEYCSEKESPTLWWMNKQMFFGSHNNYIERNNYYYLHRAVELEDNEVIAILLRFKQININLRNRYGETALYIATQLNQPKCAQLLLAAGADPTIKSQKGITPLVSYLFYKFVNSADEINSPEDYDRWQAVIFEEPICVIFEKYLQMRGITRDQIHEELASLIENINEQNEPIENDDQLDKDSIEDESLRTQHSP